MWLLSWEAITLYVKWIFGHVANLSSGDKLKKWYLHFHKTCSH